jgi:hypothetical protein
MAWRISGTYVASCSCNLIYEFASEMAEGTARGRG